MPDTPKNSSSSTTKLGSINKNHLTPCRRVGLSRTRKTPNTVTVTKAIEAELSKTQIIKSDNTEISTNFLKNESNIEVQGSPEMNPVEHKRKEAAIKNSKGKKKKRNLFESDSDSEDEIFLEYTKESQTIRDTQSVKESNIFVNKTENKIPEENNSIESVSSDSHGQQLLLKNNLEVNNEIDNLLAVSNKPINIETNVHRSLIENNKITRKVKSLNDLEHNSLIRSEKNPSKKLKRFKTNLSIKKSIENYDTDDDDFDMDYPKIKNVKIKLTQLSERDIKIPSTDTDIVPFKATLNKKLDIKPTELLSDDKCFLSTPAEETLERTTILHKIKLMEMEIKQKRDQLDHLKLASVYKCKHKPEVLMELTQKWKYGCVAALNDLIVLLQSHTPINIVTLVKNLKIPVEIVDKLGLGCQ